MRDKARQKIKQHESYLRNKERILSRNQIRRNARKKWFREEFMKDKSCTFCSESTIECLEWHHINPSIKVEDISRMLSQFRSMEAFYLEIEKCICVCANCHRKLHAGLLDLGEGVEPSFLDSKSSVLPLDRSQN